MKFTPLLHVFAKLHQPAVARLLQQVQPFGHVDLAGVAVAGERRAGIVKGHADVQGGITGPVHVHHLVPAVADAHAAMACRPHHFARTLVVHHLKGAIQGQRLLVDKGAPEARVTHKQGRDKVLFHVDVLVEQLGQQLLVDIAAQPHHGKFKEAGHRRRQDIADLSVRPLHVEKNGTIGQSIQHLLRIDQVHLPAPGCMLGREWADGQQRHQLSFFLAEQQFQDGVQRIRRGCTLGQAIQAFDKRFVAGTYGMVCHCVPP